MLGLAAEGLPGRVATWRAAEQRHFPAWRSREISFAEQRRRRLRDVLPAWGLPVPEDDVALDAVFAGYLEHYESAWHAFDDVLPALAALRARVPRIGVLTNGVVAQQRAKLAALDLADAFDVVVTAEDLGVAKPAPSAFTGACARLGTDPARTLYVGDDHEVDLLGARAAGLQAVLVDRGARAASRDVVRSLTDVVGTLA